MIITNFEKTTQTFVLILKGLIPFRPYQNRICPPSILNCDWNDVLIPISDTAEAPKFIGEMADVAVQEGEKANFECYVSGQPVPDVKW